MHRRSADQPHPRRRWVGYLIVGTLLLAACGGDEAPNAEQAGATPTTTAPTTTTIATPPTTVAPTTTAPTIPPPTTEQADSLDEWCAISVRAERLTDDMSTERLTDPAMVRALLDQLADLIDEATPVVPAEIADEWTVAVQVNRLMYAAIAAVDFDVFEADLSGLADIEVESDAADEAIEAFNEEHCGIERSVDDEDSSFDFESGTLRDQFVATLVASGFTDDEAECVFENYDWSVEAAVAGPAALAACDISPDRLLEVGQASNPEEFERAHAELMSVGLDETEADCVLRAAVEEALEVDGESAADVIAVFSSCGVDADRLGDLSFEPGGT